MVNGFNSLRHNAVIGCHYQNGDIGYLSAAGAHGGKSFMSGGIQKGDFLAVDFHLVSADMLSNTAGFGIHDIGLADGIQQSGLAVVDMAHNGDHGRTRLKVGTFFFFNLFLNLAGSAGRSLWLWL